MAVIGHNYRRVVAVGRGGIERHILYDKTSSLMSSQFRILVSIEYQTDEKTQWLFGVSFCKKYLKISEDIGGYYAAKP